MAAEGRAPADQVAACKGWQAGHEVGLCGQPCLILCDDIPARPITADDERVSPDGRAADVGGWPAGLGAPSTCWTEVAMVRDWDGVRVVMPQR
jgi:hypothetical protein